MIKSKIQALFNSEQYHGWGKQQKYFEGWYYKVVNKNEDRAFAFIPGIAMDEQGQQQAFIQILNGKKLSAEYIKFDAKDFVPTPGRFEVKIGNSKFTKEKIEFDHSMIKGVLNFKNQIPWPSSWYSPGIMGPFSFVPFMECYHGILSMDHTIEGELIIGKETIDFTGGRGYMEKDWGHSFPSGYIWMQTNHFSQPGFSIKASVAKIPWMGSSFIGFISGVWLQDRLVQFTTYNLTKIRKSYVDNAKVEIVLENGKHLLEIIANRNDATELAAPIAGFMDGRISESMTAEVEVRLFDKKNKKVLFQDRGRNAGLEVAGKVEEILV